MKRVWLNINTGEFFESWTVSCVDDTILTHPTIQKAKEEGWKLIEYTCLNDTDFELCDLMKIVTSDKSKNRQKK